MLVPFTTLPGNSKLWVYQASRFMSEDEKQIIISDIQPFLESWTAHDTNLKAGFDIMYDLFVIISVDESYNTASGCSIDKKVHFMKSAGDKTGIDFFNRLRVAWIYTDEVHHTTLNEFINDMANGKIQEDALVFNNLVFTVDEFHKSWKQPLRSSWIQSMISV